MTRQFRNRTRRVLHVEKLDQRLLLARDSVYISEFLANNDSGLKDEDGDFSDWIEIHNPTTDPVDLAGWALTDLATDPDKWTFPEVVLPANGYRIVFASDKDRRCKQCSKECSGAVHLLVPIGASKLPNGFTWISSLTDDWHVIYLAVHVPSRFNINAIA